jgi:hypothetical protein
MSSRKNPSGIEIDWTIIDQVENSKIESTIEPAVQVDWDVTPDVKSISTEIPPEEPTEIVWDLGNTDINAIEVLETADISVPIELDTPQISLEETMLSDTSTRNKFINDLLEVDFTVNFSFFSFNIFCANVEKRWNLNRSGP